MKINFDQALKALDGQPIMNETQQVTLKTVTVNSLLALFQDEQNLSGEEKAKRYVLATRIYANPDIDLVAEEIALIKKLIGKMYAPLIVGQCFNILDSR